MDTAQGGQHDTRTFAPSCGPAPSRQALPGAFAPPQPVDSQADRKSTRLNSSHGYISYAVFCLKKKTHTHRALLPRADEPIHLNLQVLPKRLEPTYLLDAVSPPIPSPPRQRGIRHRQSGTQSA